MEYYRSPCHILYYFSGEPSTEPVHLKRLQKQFIAEFNLPENSFLEIAGTTYSKNDILHVLDELEKTTHLDIHYAIYQNKEVLAFLESPDTQEIPRILDFCAEMTQQEEASFFRDLLCTALSLHTRKKLFRRSYENFSRLHSLYRFLEERHKTTLYEIIDRHLLSLKGYTASYISRPLFAVHTGVRIGNDFPFLFSQDFVSFLNQLPEETEARKYELLAEFCNFIAFCYDQDFSAGSYLSEIIPNLLRIQTLEPDMRSWLHNYLQLLSERMYRNPSPVDVDEKRIQEEVEYMSAYWESTEREEEGTTGDRPSLLTRIRNILTGKKTPYKAFIVIAVFGILSYFLWTDFRTLATLCMVIAIAVFVVALILPGGVEENTEDKKQENIHKRPGRSRRSKDKPLYLMLAESSDTERKSEKQNSPGTSHAPGIAIMLCGIFSLLLWNRYRIPAISFLVVGIVVFMIFVKGRNSDPDS